MVLPQFAHDLNWRVKFWVNSRGNQWSLIFIV